VDGREAALMRMADLKARQIEASRLLIELREPSERAAAVLRGRGLPVEVSGPSALIVEASDGNGLDALEALRGAGIQMRSFQLQRPTLEELFLSVVRGGRR
jgi:hypothetical protein